MTGMIVGSNGMRPNRLKMLVGSGADRSWIQPKNGACRISMVTNSTLYSEKNTGIWMSDRQTAGQRIDLLLLVQLHHRLLLLRPCRPRSARGCAIICGCTAFIFAIEA